MPLTFVQPQERERERPIESGHKLKTPDSGVKRLLPALSKCCERSVLCQPVICILFRSGSVRRAEVFYADTLQNGRPFAAPIKSTYYYVCFCFRFTTQTEHRATLARGWPLLRMA
jgi:hypothetical protein